MDFQIAATILAIGLLATGVLFGAARCYREMGIREADQAGKELGNLQMALNARDVDLRERQVIVNEKAIENQSEAMNKLPGSPFKD